MRRNLPGDRVWSHHYIRVYQNYNFQIVKHQYRQVLFLRERRNDKERAMKRPIVFHFSIYNNFESMQIDHLYELKKRNASFLIDNISHFRDTLTAHRFKLVTMYRSYNERWTWYEPIYTISMSAIRISIVPRMNINDVSRIDMKPEIPVVQGIPGLKLSYDMTCMYWSLSADWKACNPHQLMFTPRWSSSIINRPLSSGKLPLWHDGKNRG